MTNEFTSTSEFTDTIEFNVMSNVHDAVNSVNMDTPIEDITLKITKSLDNMVDSKLIAGFILSDVNVEDSRITGTITVLSNSQTAPSEYVENASTLDTMKLKFHIPIPE